MQSQDIAPTTISGLELTRRLHFRLLGRAPTRAELNQSIAESDWSKTVDRLILHPDFQRTREEFWIGILGIEEAKDRIWIKEQITANSPINTRLLEWFTFQRTLSRNPDEAAIYLERFGPSLLGAGFECSRCHDHPFETTTLHDFLEMSAFFRKDGYVEIPPGYLYNDATPGELIAARTNFGPEVGVFLTANDRKRIHAGAALTKNVDPGKVFGNWISDFRDNPRPFYFLSAHYRNWLTSPEDLARLIESNDDEISQPPEKLADIVRLFRQSNFDEVAMIREMSVSVSMATTAARRSSTRTQWLRSIETTLGFSIPDRESAPGPESPLLERSQFLDRIFKDYQIPKTADLDQIWLDTLTRLPTDNERTQITKLVEKHDLPVGEIYRALFLSDEFKTIP